MRARLSILITTLLFYSGQCCADGWQQNGSVSVSAAYNTNPLLSAVYPGGAWIRSLTPSYTLNGNIGANQFGAGLAYRIQRSSNEVVSPYREDPTVSLDWKHQTDLDEFGIFTQYFESSTRVAEINNIVPGFIDSNAFFRIISGTWKRTLSPRSTFLAGGSYESVSYGGGLYTDYVTRTADVMLNYDWNEHGTPFVKISYVDYMPVNAIQLTSISTVMLGLNWIVSDSLQGDLQAGESQGTDLAMDPQFETAVHYKGQRTGFDFSASRLTALNGLSGFILSDQIAGSWNYALSEYNKAGIDMGRRKNHYIPPVTNSNAGAWLEHDFNSGWVWRTYALHRTSEGGSSSASSNELGIIVVYTQTDF
jgi:hypothetical protein